MCEVLKVSRSGFYAWRSRPESERSKHHRELVAEMKRIHADRDMKSYGSPRVQRELAVRGKRCSVNTVAKLMQQHGLAARTRKRYRSTTDSSHSLAVAENVLDREFEQEAPDRVWLADITCIWTLEGWLYLAAVLDAHSRKVVGWSMSHRMPTSLVLDACGWLWDGAAWIRPRLCCITVIAAASMPAVRIRICCGSTTSPAA